MKQEILPGASRVAALAVRGDGDGRGKYIESLF